MSDASAKRPIRGGSVRLQSGPPDGPPQGGAPRPPRQLRELFSGGVDHQGERHTNDTDLTLKIGLKFIGDLAHRHPTTLRRGKSVLTALAFGGGEHDDPGREPEARNHNRRMMRDMSPRQVCNTAGRDHNRDYEYQPEQSVTRQRRSR